MRKFYGKKYYSQEKDTIKLNKRKENLRNGKVAMSKQKLQDK
jgi:ubiquitin